MISGGASQQHVGWIVKTSSAGAKAFSLPMLGSDRLQQLGEAELRLLAQ